jgi:hypothetical protein
MNRIFEDQDRIDIEASLPSRRSFVKCIASVGAEIAVSPFISTLAKAQTVGLDTSSQVDTDPAIVQDDKIDWHGFDRYDFALDDQTLTITPVKAPADDQTGNVTAAVSGQQRCILVMPKIAASGKPWSWRGVYWNHLPQTEIELLKRGFHIAFVSPDVAERTAKEWDTWYAYLTGTYGLSKKPAFVGMSRGGEFAYSWGSANPDKVSCIYADNPGMNAGAFQRLADLARADVPVLQICGSVDPIFGKYASAIESIYQQFGGRVSMMVKEGYAHHPHSLRNPKPIADFIEQSANAVRRPSPAFVGAMFARTSYYSIENFYRDYQDEGTHITCRGPLFTACYDRYEFNVRGTPMTTNVIVPNTAAAGMPWVYRAGFVFRDAKVDQALLAKGFHIVTGPVGTDVDGPLVKDWDTVYEHLTGYGFSKKVVMEGAGGAACDSYAWAIENPDKVCCIYAENPVLQSNQFKAQPIDNLAPLAKAYVPLLHVCGNLDPAYKDNTLVAEMRYRKLGGQIQIILKKNQGHYPLAPDDPEPPVNFITEAALLQ